MYTGASGGNDGVPMASVDVAAPERVVRFAEGCGMNAWSSMDITTCDSGGRPWDFSQDEMRRRACARSIEEDPVVLSCISSVR